MMTTKKMLRKIGIALIGFPLLIIGILLIPLPGPGLLVCLAALFILSLEFAWAQPYLDRTRQALDKAKALIRERANRARTDKDR